MVPFRAPRISISASYPELDAGSTKSWGLTSFSVWTLCGIEKSAFVFVKSIENSFDDNANPPFVNAVYVVSVADITPPADIDIFVPAFAASVNVSCLDDNSVFKAVFLPKGYDSVDILIKVQKEAYRRFYFRFAYVLKHLKNIQNYEDIKKYWLGFKFALGMSKS